MILEGFKLMVLGMVIVYVFLIILMVLVIISAKVFKGHALTTSYSHISSAKKADDDLIAVLSAASSAYRNRNTKK
ncbi:MAG: OadG family protein [Thermodesulfobacteriota bacterium]